MKILNNAIKMIPVKPINLNKSFSIPEDKKVVGIVGKIIPERGYDFFLRAFKELRSQKQDVCLLIVGHGEKKQIKKLKKLVKAMNLDEAIYFTGHHPEAKGIISSLNILAIPYSIEPFGRVLLEAWSTKTPVILTDVGQIRKIVTHNENGLLVQYGDHERLIDSIIKLLKDNGFREKITNKAFETCQSNFSIENFCKKMDQIYSEVLEKCH
jgi:glycosyltransferase involved in cell wall biosynthesis